MRKIPISLVKPDMMIGRAIVDASGRILINEGIKLSSKYIYFLQKIGISSIYVEDGLAPDLIVEDVIPPELRFQAITQVRDMMSEVKQAKLSKVIQETKKIGPTIESIIEELLNQKSITIDSLDMRLMDSYLFAHSVNVCVLALITGISMGYTRGQLHFLGFSTMLHDIGMTKINSKITNKAGPLTKEEKEEVKKHTIYGYELLKQVGENPLIAKVAYEHHERYQGQGYPQGLKGEDISEFARIVAVVDTYDALTSDRVYKKAVYPHEAFEILQGSGNFLFDFRIVQAFLSNIAAYATGSMVQLSTGQKGIVIKTPHDFPNHPVIRILSGVNGESVVPFEIELAKQTSIVIKYVIEE